MKLRELAEKLGLSQTTVSRALNGFPEVSEETRARVRAAADLHGYAPSAAARRLAQGRSGAIGLILPATRDLSAELLFTEFLRGCVERASTLGYDINLSMVQDGQPEDLAYRRAVQSAHLDALIVTSPRTFDPRLLLLRELEVPFVVHGRSVCNVPYAFLDIDNEGAFCSATRFLMDLQHRRIALLNGDTHLSFAADRERGYRMALASRDLGLPRDLSFSGRMNEQEGRAAAGRMLSLPGSARPTAFLCSSIALASGVRLAAADAGLEIGRDIALIAHDDRLQGMEAEVFDPPLTAIQSSLSEAGKRIVEICLATLCKRDEPPPQEVWPANLVVRQSTMPAPR